MKNKYQMEKQEAMKYIVSLETLLRIKNLTDFEKNLLLVVYMSSPRVISVLTRRLDHCRAHSRRSATLLSE